MHVINLMPHMIKIVTPGWVEGEPLHLDLPPSGEVARVAVQDGSPIPYEEAGPFAWITRLGPATYGEVTDLPEPKEGTVYIVSLLVLQALAGQGRTDVYAPDTGPNGAVRDGDGKLVATTRLLRAS